MAMNLFLTELLMTESCIEEAIGHLPVEELSDTRETLQIISLDAKSIGIGKSSDKLLTLTIHKLSCLQLSPHKKEMADELVAHLKRLQQCIGV